MSVAQMGEHTLSAIAVDVFLQETGQIADRVICRTAEEVIGVLQREEVDYAVLPGAYSGGGTYSLYLFSQLPPIWEVVGVVPLLPRLYLWGVPGASLSTLQQVVSDLEALNACRKSLDALGLSRARYNVPNTAEAARLVAGEGGVQVAALCPERPAQVYGLVRLSEEPLNQPPVETPFLIIGQCPVSYAGWSNRTMFAVKNNARLVTTVFQMALQQGRSIEKCFSFYVYGEEGWMVFEILGHDGLPPVRQFLESVKQAIKGENYRFIGSYFLFPRVEC